MADTKNKTKKQPVSKDNNKQPLAPMDRKHQLRLGFGVFFLLLGIFTCFAITSYFFTWKADQDKVFDMNGIWHFLFRSQAPVANWGGRMGAVIGHVLVYKAVGIAAIAIGFSITGIGLNLLYRKRVVPVLRYMRWVSILLLIIAPVLAYMMPHAAFSYGGAWGNVAIEYLNGFLGFAGTGLVLFAILCFFVFVIFALDIRPFLRRMQLRAQNVAAAMKPLPVFTEETNTVTEPDTTPLAANEIPAKKEWDMLLNEKTPQTVNELFAVKEPAATETLMHETANDATEEDAEEETTDDTDLSLKVNMQKVERVIKHGDHISIGDKEPYAPEESLRSYKFPTLDLLEDRSQEVISVDRQELERNKDQIIKTLSSFGIDIQHITATVGPTVTLYEIVPAEGVRISKIRNLEDDIALSLSALGIRIIAPIPGKGTIGIEVPNANKQIVSMRALLSSEKFVNSKMTLPIALGKKIDNENYIVDLTTMPHLLMAGATGQGKSVGINAILVSLLYKKHPSQLKFVMVDPKKVELSIYRTIEKHFLAKLPNEAEAIITDIKKVIYTLRALCDEMDDRYGLLKDAGARNIKEYNEKFISRKLNPENGHKFLPFIVLVIDEFADLIMTAGKEVEMPIARLAQLARAVGIHLIIATQRPSVNVITGTIKANFPSRIAFKVSAKVDSRTILDTGGAEQLVGRGDMLISHGSELLRLQCAFVDTHEVENVVAFIGDQKGYEHAHFLPEPEMDQEDINKEFDAKTKDSLFDQCAQIVVETQQGSTSMLQRRFNLGYNRAGRIMDQMEAAGIVGPVNGSKPREVRIKTLADLGQFLGPAH